MKTLLDKLKAAVLSERFVCESFAVARGAITILLYAWTVSLMWGWFVVSIFHGLPQLSLLQAYVLSLLTWLILSSRLRLREEGPPTSMVLATLLIGWVIHTFFWS